MDSLYWTHIPQEGGKLLFQNVPLLGGMGITNEWLPHAEYALFHLAFEFADKTSCLIFRSLFHFFLPPPSCTLS